MCMQQGAQISNTCQTDKPLEVIFQAFQTSLSFIQPYKRAFSMFCNPVWKKKKTHEDIQHAVINFSITCLPCRRLEFFCLNSSITVLLALRFTFCFIGLSVVFSSSVIIFSWSPKLCCQVMKNERGFHNPTLPQFSSQSGIPVQIYFHLIQEISFQHIQT